MSVFANGLGVSGKATGNKTIAAMPDVCLSPPPPPAGPVPIPYPMTGMASDTSDGCTSVIVKGKEAGKKNSTKYSKTMGNEPATNSFGANVISHKLSGALKFAAYSFDVIFEGGGACRFTDLTTQNHMNIGGGSVSASVAAAVLAMIDAKGPCAVLSAMNRTEFQRAKKKSGKTTGAEAKKLKDFESSGTVSHAMVTSAGGSRSIHGGTSSAVVRQNSHLSDPAKSKAKHLVPGKNAAGKDTKLIPQKICDNASPYEHPQGGVHAHAEPCILAGMGSVAPRATVVMAIEWHSRSVVPAKKAKKKGLKSKTRKRDSPCGNCKKVLEHACQCMDIVLCNQDGSGTRSGCPKPAADPV